MVRVDHRPVLAVKQAFDAVVEVVEVDAVVKAVTAGRTDHQAGSPDGSDRHERQPLEPNQRLLLRQLIDGHAVSGEDRDGIGPVRRVSPAGVHLQQIATKLTAPDDHDSLISELITRPDVPLLHVSPSSDAANVAATPASAPSRACA
jgi:hypothetical protein